MRVIAGTAGGRPLVAPRGDHVRPTTDRVKEALFSSLLPRLAGARVLDLYAGSGGLGIEALSRGAAHATFVERDTRALAALRRNLESTGLAGAAEVVAADVASALARTRPDVPFDVVLLDPPYDVGSDVLAGVLAAVARAVAPGGIVVLELGRHSVRPPWPPGLRPGRERRYGATVLYEAHPADEERE